MRPISEMSTEELQDLLSIATDAGTPIYYSTITRIAKDSALIDGEIVEGISPEGVKSLRKGKLNYEAYRLQMSSDELHSILTDKVDTLVDERIKALLNPLKSQVESTSKAIKHIADDSSSISTFFPATFSEDFKSRLDSTLSNIKSSKADFDSITTKLKSLLE